MNDRILISVVIPFRNEEKLLPKMLDCLLKQTFQDWRAYCVDDQSTDRTADVVKAYQVKDSHIQYVRREREPKGGQTCRNIGLDLAINEGTKYVCFFDADDMVAPYCFEQRVKYMDGHPELDCGVFPALAYADDVHEETGPVFGIKVFGDDIEAMLNQNLPMTGWTNIYRASCFEKYGLRWDEKVLSMQDSDFSFQMILSNMKYDYAAEAKADYYYQVGREGVSKNIQAPQHYNSHVYLIDKVTRNVCAKYGKKYDFCLEAMIVNFLGTFREAWQPYFDLLRMPWMRGRWRFKLRILLYMAILKMDRRVLFYKYRKYSKKQNIIWKKSMAELRKELLEREIAV